MLGARATPPLVAAGYGAFGSTGKILTRYFIVRGLKLESCVEDYGVG